MYRDAKEELQRLEEALLAEEDQKTLLAEAKTQRLDISVLAEAQSRMPQPEQTETQEDAEQMPEDDLPVIPEADMEEEELFAEEMPRQKPQDLTALVILALSLAGAVVAVLLFWLIRYWGIFG